MAKGRHRHAAEHGGTSSTGDHTPHWGSSGADPPELNFPLGQGNSAKVRAGIASPGEAVLSTPAYEAEGGCGATFPWRARLPGSDTTVLQNQLLIKGVLHSAEIKEPEQMSLSIFPPCNDGK